MSTLPAPLRRRLESTILAARLAAATGVTKGLQALAVHEPDPYRHMNEAQREHRRRLRAQARQLGDGESRVRPGYHEISHIVEKAAYDQWHRLLFARYLLEKNLLIHPDLGVPVSLEDCQELAPHIGLQDAWAVAARFAAVELPEIFRSDDPAGSLELPVEDREALLQHVRDLPVEIFTAADSLGWCYQFWQADRRDQVNASGRKIGADELPSVTQLFTEDYMVDFLLDNTLGAWHAGRVIAGNPALAETAGSEAELRGAVALPGCPWSYLRFIKGPEGRWSPAAGTFAGWPQRAEALRCLDPCMGSGHFIVALFQRLTALRLAEGPLDEAGAVAAVIRENLFGLEIDPRCTQIAAFNLAFAAWCRVGHCRLPAMNLACSGLAPNTREAEWVAIVDAASSRTPNEKQKRQDAAATFAPIGYFRPDEPVANLTGNLPHWRQEGTTYFVTFRCADALPQEKLQLWQQELAEWQAAHPEPHDDATRSEFYERFPQRIQAWLDAGCGECVLREPAMREIVESALRHFEGERYRLGGFVVAANHVHALVTPMGGHLLSDILHSWKSFTVNKINEARKRSGAFWQKESFDHIVRSPASLAKFREYILSHNREAAPSSCVSSPGHSLQEERLEAAATLRLRAGMERLYRLFQQASVLGSLINPRAGEGDLLVAGFHELQPLLERVLKVEEASSLSSDPKTKSREGSATLHEMAVTARGLAKAAEILAGQFTLVATNVPYLGRGKQDVVLMDYCERVHPEAKADLATSFVERSMDYCSSGGTFSLVTPQNWLFLTTYRSLRESLFSVAQLDVVALLGPGAFETIGGEAVNVALIAATRKHAGDEQALVGTDVRVQRTPAAKADALAIGAVVGTTHGDLRASPDGRFTLERKSNIPLLEKFADSLQGISTADNPRLVRLFWERPTLGDGFHFLQGTTKLPLDYAGREQVVRLDKLELDLEELGGAIRGKAGWGKRAVLVNRMGTLLASAMSGEIFDINVAVILPRKQSDLLPIYALCRSTDFCEMVRKVDPKMNVTNATLGKIPFDLAHWQQVAAEKYPDGLPKPFSSDPTQWLFNGHPSGADQPLHVAVARLLGYQWPRQTGSSFPDCPALEPDGLEDLADADGIVPISPAIGEAAAADRLRELLGVAYGPAWSATLQEQLLAGAGCPGTTLEDWLRNSFFEQHCALFHHRPFIWHIWDGLKNGFSALVNYHKLNRANLEKLTYAYLGDWIRRQQAAVEAGEGGSDARLEAARQLQSTLKLILDGEPPHDLFVRWKPLAQQAIGWQPDLNDGVRTNIRPFATANLLRKRVKIKWEKDRGREPERIRQEYPWFWGWDGERHDFAGGREFTGDRWNDCHYTCEFKRRARG